MKGFRNQDTFSTVYWLNPEMLEDIRNGYHARIDIGLVALSPLSEEWNMAVAYTGQDAYFKPALAYASADWYGGSGVYDLQINHWSWSILELSSGHNQEVEAGMTLQYRMSTRGAHMLTFILMMMKHMHRLSHLSLFTTIQPMISDQAFHTFITVIQMLALTTGIPWQDMSTHQTEVLQH